MSYDLGTAHGKIEISYDSDAAVGRATKDIGGVAREADKADDPLKKLVKTLGSLGKVLGKGTAIAGTAVALTNAAVAAGAATVQILGMVPALASVASLSAALPGLFVGMAASVGVLKAAFAGVGDTVKAAFSTDDAKKFDEALKKLAPSAQTFAKAFKSDLVPGLKSFQQGIQQAFFSNNLQSVFPNITAAMKTLSPTLRSLASQFGGVAKQVVLLGTGGKSIAFVRAAVTNFQVSIDNLVPSIKPVLNGLLDVGRVGLPLMTQLTDAVGIVADAFGKWLTKISNSGQLLGWIGEAKTTLATLGGIIGNVAKVLASVFTAAQATGGGLLNTLNDLTGQAAAFLGGAEGQDLLQSVFGALLETSRQLAPVVTTLASALGGALAPVLQSIATDFGPMLLKVVQQLAPAFGPLAGAIGDLLSAVAPLLPPLAKFVSMLATALASGISALASEFGPVVSVLGGAFLQALQALQPVLSTLVANALPQAAVLGGQLAQAFAPLGPVIVQTAQAFATAILPVLPQIVSLMAALTPIVLKVAGVLVVLLTAGLKVAAWLAGFGASLIGAMTAVVGAFTGLKDKVVGAFTSVYNTIVSVGTTIVGFFAALPGRIGSALAALPGAIVNIVKTAVSNAAFAFGAGIGVVISFAAAAPGRIAAAFSALVSTLRSVAVNAWNAVKSAISSGISAAVGIARAAPGRIRGALSALPGLLRSAASSAFNSFRSAISSGIGSAVSLARSIPGKIKSAVGNLGSALVSAGRDAVLGLVNGIRGAIGAAVSAAASVGHSVVAGIKSTLKIHSPSRVMVTLGRFINQGLVSGLEGTAKQVQAAANKVANLVRDAYSDRAIRKGQKNTVLTYVANANVKLQRLVAQSNSVASRLKTAQANLKSVTAAYAKAGTDASAAVLQSFQLVTPGETFVSIDRLKARLAKTVGVAKQFAADMQTLAKRGLNKDFLAQLAEAGAAGGGTMAHALANAGTTDIKALNALQGQLNTAAGTVGKSVADALYGAGVKAAQGLVKGLQSQQKAIDKQMASIANILVKNIKKALKIKSPSRVFFDLGRFISRGLLNGIISLHKEVGRAASQLAKSAIAPTVALPANSPFVAARRVTSGAAAVASGGFTVNQTVNALPGMSAKQVSNYSASKLSLLVRTGNIAVATAPPANQEA